MTCSIVRFDRRRGVCDICGMPLHGRKRQYCSDRCRLVYYRNHIWSWARPFRIATDGGRCIRCGSRESLEVNHIRPLEGRGYQAGCEHHQTGLETLCHDCHVIETNRQRREVKIQELERLKDLSANRKGQLFL